VLTEQAHACLGTGAAAAASTGIGLSFKHGLDVHEIEAPSAIMSFPKCQSCSSCSRLTIAHCSRPCSLSKTPSWACNIPSDNPPAIDQATNHSSQPSSAAAGLLPVTLPRHSHPQGSGTPAQASERHPCVHLLTRPVCLALARAHLCHLPPLPLSPAGEAADPMVWTCGRTPSELCGRTPSELCGRTPSELCGRTPSELCGRTPSELCGRTPSELCGRTPSELCWRTPSELCGRTPSELCGRTPSELSGSWWVLVALDCWPRGSVAGSGHQGSVAAGGFLWPLIAGQGAQWQVAGTKAQWQLVGSRGR